MVFGLDGFKKESTGKPWGNHGETVGKSWWFLPVVFWSNFPTTIIRFHRGMVESWLLARKSSLQTTGGWISMGFPINKSQMSFPPMNLFPNALFKKKKTIYSKLLGLPSKFDIRQNCHWTFRCVATPNMPKHKFPHDFFTFASLSSHHIELTFKWW